MRGDGERTVMSEESLDLWSLLTGRKNFNDNKGRGSTSAW